MDAKASMNNALEVGICDYLKADKHPEICSTTWILVLHLQNSHLKQNDKVMFAMLAMWLIGNCSVGMPMSIFPEYKVSQQFQGQKKLLVKKTNFYFAMRLVVLSETCQQPIMCTARKFGIDMLASELIVIKVI